MANSQDAGRRAEEIVQEQMQRFTMDKGLTIEAILHAAVAEAVKDVPAEGEVSEIEMVPKYQMIVAVAEAVAKEQEHYAELWARQDALIAEAVKERDFQWWEKIACVDNVAPTPEACTWFVASMQEHWIDEARREEREQHRHQRRLGHVFCPACVAALSPPASAPDKEK